MPQIINTNIASLTAQRNLNGSQNSLATSLQRLSTGLRINSAKDDAAGLAISERFTTQIRGLNQAIRNANDGVSFAQTAEGALSTTGDALQRIRELAVQSINDTNSSADRQALNNEASQLIAEINRISNSTQFNGQNILDGSLSTLTFQVGANQGQTIQVDGVDSRTSQLGARTSTSSSFTSAVVIVYERRSGSIYDYYCQWQCC
jgi:flagellin